MAILAVNAGSSSLKFALYPRQGARVLPALLSGSIQGLEPGGQPTMGWTIQGAPGVQAVEADVQGDAFGQSLAALRRLLAGLPGLPAIEAVAHRVVHGGGRYRASVQVDEQVLDDLARFNSLAPLHQPHNIEGIRALRAAFAGLPQVACFDTAFHADMPEVASAFALPQELAAQGVRRYGFHGLSYQYVMGRLEALSPQLARGRVLMAHLGNGASLCAAVEGRSQATTMGFSALDGLMMGTRCGAIDAGVLLYLLEQGWDHDRLQELLYKRSGLLGVSGISADMRRLRADGSVMARKAIDQFTYRVVRESGALAACIGGLDMLAFSGGIGEHDAALREQVGTGLAYLGVVLDPARNRAARGDAVAPIHAPGSRVEVWVIPTDEGQIAAREAAALLAAGGA